MQETDLHAVNLKINSKIHRLLLKGSTDLCTVVTSLGSSVLYQPSDVLPAATRIKSAAIIQEEIKA